MNKIEKGKILSLENIFMNLSEKVKTLEENFENNLKFDQKKILQFGNQLKAFGVEMDRIEEAYRKFVEENLDHVHETTEYADKRIKKLEDLKDFIFHHNHEGKIEKVNGRCDSIREIFQNLSNKVNAQDKTIEDLEKQIKNHSHPHSHRGGHA